MKHGYSFLIQLSLIFAFLLFNLIISKHYIHKNFTPDESLYNSMALAITEGSNTFRYEKQNIDMGQEVTPFYPATIAGSYLIYKSKWSPLILNILLSSVTIIMVFNIIRNIIGNQIIAFFSVLCFILYFPLWAYNFYIMMEISTVFLLSLLILFISKYYINFEVRHLFVTVAVFSILVLLNNRFLALFCIFFLILLWQTFKTKVLPVKKLIFSILLAFIIIGPWFVRQFVVYDQFVFFTPKWNNLVSGELGILKPVDFTSIEDMSESYELQDYKFYLEQIEANVNNVSGYGHQFTSEKYQTAIREREKIKNIYFARLIRYFTLYDKDFRFMYPDSYRMVVPSSRPYKLIQIVILSPLFIFSFFGFAEAIIKKKGIIICLSLYWFSHIFLHIIIHYIDRYRLTVLPVLLIIGAYGFSEMVEMIKKHFTKSFAHIGVSEKNAARH